MPTPTVRRVAAPSPNRPSSKVTGRSQEGSQERHQTPQRQAFLSAVRSLESVESPSAMQIVTQVLSQTLPEAQPRARTQAKEQDAQLEWKALQRAFEFRRGLLKDAITTTQVAQLLGISRQAVGERERKGQLLGAMESGQLRFPLWQFDPAGSGGVVEGLPLVLRALDEDGALPPLAKMSWLRKANASVGGATPLEALRGGRLAETLSAARGAIAS